jgi:hypothetical protein
LNWAGETPDALSTSSGRFELSGSVSANELCRRCRRRPDASATLILDAYCSAFAGMTPVAMATAIAWVRFMQCNLWRAVSR